MALGQVLVVPPTALSPGTLGPVESPLLDPAATKFVVVTTPVVWPVSGDVLKLTVEESQDGGATYRFSAGNSLAAVDGGIGLKKDGTPLLFDTWTTTFMFAGASRKLRLTLEVLQACTVGATVSVQ